MILSGWESVFFWIFSITAILAGLLTVMARNAVHSALFLISSLVSVAALFILLGAEFIAGVQILVFLGLLALVLVLYVIPKGAEKLKNPERQMQAAIAREAREQSLQTGATGVSRITKETERVGKSLYTYASLPFEIASLLLLVAIIGSVMLARTLKQEMAADDADPEVVKAAGLEDQS